MEITIGLICTITGALIGYFTFLKNSRKETKQETKDEIEARAEQSLQLAKIDVKLDTVMNNTSEMRLEQKDMNKQFQRLSERVTIVEQSAKSAHHRLDTLEGRDDKK